MSEELVFNGAEGSEVIPILVRIGREMLLITVRAKELTLMIGWGLKLLES